LFGSYFSDFFQRSIRNLISSDFKRLKNPGAPFKFGENHLREHIRTILNNGSFALPAEWPPFLFERKVQDDSSIFGNRHGGVDYFFVKDRSAQRYSLNEILATCEMKGPTRPKLLQGSKVNWYEGVREDLKKQVSRATNAPQGEHYVAILLQPLSGGDTRTAFANVLDSLLTEIQVAKTFEAHWTQMADVDNLNIVILRVMPK
jgi:hypothetical protein